MPQHDISVGDRLEITLKHGKTPGRKYVSQVENILESGGISACVPVSYGRLAILPERETCSVQFYTEKGMLTYDAVIEIITGRTDAI